MPCHMSANLLNCNVLSCLISSSLLSVLPICENIPGIPQRCQNFTILTLFAFLSFLKLQFIFFIDYTVSQGAAVMRLSMWTGLTVSLSLRVCLFFLTLICYFLFFLFLSVSPSFFIPNPPPRPAVILSMGVQGRSRKSERTGPQTSWNLCQTSPSLLSSLFL